MKILKPLVYVLVLVVAACSSNDDDLSDVVEGYIVSSFICEKTDASGQATGIVTERGYGILLDTDKNTQAHRTIDFYTFNLPENQFDFPQEIIGNGSDGANCGPIFFPDDLKNAYKIKFRYKILNKSEKVAFVCGPCTSLEPTFSWDDYDEVVLELITIVKPED